ncbi:MAG: hypothetical protein ACTHL1_07500 [Burkholderiaceae bacterium]
MHERIRSGAAAPAALLAVLSLVSLGGCGDDKRAGAGSDNPVMQTHFPGEYTAGGGTSGEVIGRSSPVGSGNYQAGTPGIAGGAGGNAGGTATGGAVQESGQGPSSGASTTGAAGGKGEAGSSAAPPPDAQSKSK